MSRVRLDALITVDESGFACSKTKLIESGLPHLRPFNISSDGHLDFSEVYQVPETEAPSGKTYIDAGDILFNNTNSAELVGKSALVQSAMKAGFSNHLSRIRLDRGQIEPAFFSFWLKQLRSTGFFTAQATQWVSQAAYKTSEMRKLEIDLPSLPEQRRVADLLSRAEGIVRLRREAERCAAQLIPSLFLDLFGDPAKNPKEWPEYRLGDIAEVVSGVTKGRKFGDKQTVEAPYLRVANVQAGHIDLSVLKTIEVLPREVEQLALQRGDVVLTEGGDFDKLGRGALWDHDVPNCVHQNHVFRVRLNQSVALPEFFVTYLQARKARENFLRCAKRTTNLASINMTQLRALPVVLPSMEVQREFLEHFNATRSIQSQQSAATAKAQAAFDALLARCFDPTTANDIRGAA